MGAVGSHWQWQAEEQKNGRRENPCEGRATLRAVGSPGEPRRNGERRGCFSGAKCVAAHGERKDRTEKEIPGEVQADGHPEGAAAQAGYGEKNTGERGIESGEQGGLGIAVMGESEECARDAGGNHRAARL